MNFEYSVLNVDRLVQWQGPRVRRRILYWIHCGTGREDLFRCDTSFSSVKSIHSLTVQRMAFHVCKMNNDDHNDSQVLKISLCFQLPVIVLVQCQSSDPAAGRCFLYTTCSAPNSRQTVGDQVVDTVEWRRFSEIVGLLKGILIATLMTSWGFLQHYCLGQPSHSHQNAFHSVWCFST